MGFFKSIFKENKGSGNQDIILTKSKIVRGFKCERSLWLLEHKPELRQVPNEGTLERGTEIGKLAQQYFPGGELVVPNGSVPSHKTADKTLDLIQRGVKTLYEATFIYDGILVAVDILQKEKDGWHIYEVKSSTEVEEYHILDASTQFYVVSKCLDEVLAAHIIHINNKYVRKGKIDVKKLFKCEDVTKEVRNKQQDIVDAAGKFKTLIASGHEPSSCQKCCKKWYDCDFLEYCFPSPAHTVSRKKTVDEDKVRKFVGQFEYPVAHLDFESIQPVVPLWDNSRPYQQIPFQYSIHLQREPDSKYEHFEYLAVSDIAIDPREALIKQLIDNLKDAETVFAYNCAFERSRIKEMAEDFPKYSSQLMKISKKIFELGEPFSKGYYQFDDLDKGIWGPQRKWSIKQILPRINPDLSYDKLDEVHNGTQAQDIFMELYDKNNPKNTPQRIEKTRKNMLAYCGQDTSSMVDIWEELKKYL